MEKKKTTIDEFQKLVSNQYYVSSLLSSYNLSQHIEGLKIMKFHTL
jgi:hypothetical protein